MDHRFDVESTSTSIIRRSGGQNHVRVDVEIRSIDVIDVTSTMHFSLGKAPRTTHFTWRSLGIQIQSRPQTDLSHLCTLSTRTSYVRFFSLRKAVVQLNSAGDTRKAAPPSPSKVGPFQMSSCDKSTSMCKSFGARLDGARRGPCTIQARLGGAWNIPSSFKIQR